MSEEVDCSGNVGLFGKLSLTDSEMIGSIMAFVWTDCNATDDDDLV